MPWHIYQALFPQDSSNTYLDFRYALSTNFFFICNTPSSNHYILSYMTPLIDDLIMTNDDRHHGKDDDEQRLRRLDRALCCYSLIVTYTFCVSAHLMKTLKIYPRSLVCFPETVERDRTQHKIYAGRLL